jgi:hypothetical protein
VVRLFYWRDHCHARLFREPLRKSEDSGDDGIRLGQQLLGRHILDRLDQLILAVNPVKVIAGHLRRSANDGNRRRTRFPWIDEPATRIQIAILRLIDGLAVQLLVRHFLYFFTHHRNDLEPFSTISLILAFPAPANGIRVQPSS